MANFYLKKHDKENSITDSMQLSQGYYRSADEYYMASKFLTQDLNFMMVALTNIAFSCELYLKALLVGFFGTDYKKEKQIEDSHNIEELFKALCLLRSIPNIDNDEHERLIPITGTPIDLLNLPKGCAFAPRCEAAMKVCLCQKPKEVRVGCDHLSACWMNVLEGQKQGKIIAGEDGRIKAIDLEGTLDQAWEGGEA